MSFELSALYIPWIATIHEQNQQDPAAACTSEDRSTTAWVGALAAIIISKTNTNQLRHINNSKFLYGMHSVG